MTTPTFTITTDNAKAVFAQVREMVARGLRSGPVQVILGRPDDPRTLAQNRKMWPMLNDFENQAEWYGKKYKDHQWKDLLTSAFREQESAPGLNGGVVVFGIRTSKMKKKDFAEFIEFMYAVGTERFDIKWSDPALALYEEVSKWNKGEK